MTVYQSWKDFRNHLVQLPCFTGKDTEARRGEVTCPRPYSQCQAGRGLELDSLGSLLKHKLLTA